MCTWKGNMTICDVIGSSRTPSTNSPADWPRVLMDIKQRSLLAKLREKEEWLNVLPFQVPSLAGILRPLSNVSLYLCTYPYVVLHYRCLHDGSPSVVTTTSCQLRSSTLRSHNTPESCSTSSVTNHSITDVSGLSYRNNWNNSKVRVWFFDRNLKSGYSSWTKKIRPKK